MKPKAHNRLTTKFHNLNSLMGLCTLIVTCSLSHGANLYWDANGATAGSGNSGAPWEGSNWTSDSTGSTLTGPWVNGSSAVFSAGTDGTGDWTVSLSSTVNTPSILFEEVANTRNINGGTINIGGGTINSTVNGTGTNGNNGRDVNINSLLTGSGGLTLAANGNHITNGGGGGGSELRLGNAGNNFTGGLTITNGLVSWSTNQNLGDAANIVTLNGGGLLYSSDPILTLPRAIEVGTNGGTFRLYGGKNLYITGSISNVSGVGTTTLRRTDGGAIRIYGSMAGFTGTYLNGGGDTYIPVANANLSATDLQLEGGTFYLNGSGTAVVNKITSNANLNIDNGTTVNVDTGAIVLTAGGTYATTVGTLGKLTTSTGTLTFTSGAASGTLGTSGPQMQVEITDSGATPVSLVKNNVGNLVLGKPNTYTGSTTINAGRIDLKDANGFSAGAVTVNSGGQAYIFTGTPVANNITINGNGPTEGTSFGALRFASPSVLTGTVNVASASRVGADTAHFGTIAGTLTGSSALEKTGAGTVSITGNASGFSGPITVTAGTLGIGTTLPGNVSANDGASVAGEGTISGSLTLGSTVGAGILVNPAPGALATTNLTVNGITTVRLTTTPGSGLPVDVVTYTGTLTMPGTADDSFALLNETLYRNPPTFANTGSAITMTIPAGANLLWVGNVDGNWNQNITNNWSNGTGADYFYAGDNVTFDDTGLLKTVTMSGMLSPANVTFNNSTGNDYTIAPNGANFGFTGPTNIIKNGTGTVLMQGYSHNFTGTVTINDGIYKASGANEVLGNTSGVTINDSLNGGGQLDMNGQNIGAGTRHYNMTIAGDGPNALGAITNTGAGSPNESAGILNLTLSADAAVGGTGGRYDIGRSGPSFGSINGAGFTLTKVGTNTVCMRAPATNVNYVVSSGTLKFEDYNSASGGNAINVNGGTLQSYGPRSFANTLNFANATTLDSDGGGNQVWTGPVNLTGAAGSNVNISARNGAIQLDGVISGASDLSINSTNITYLTGTASNTNTGKTAVTSTGQLVLWKSGGAVAVAGDLYLSSSGTRAVVSALLDNQFGPNSVVRYTGSGDNRLELKGTTQTIAGLDNTTATPGYNCVQHSEFGSPPAVDDFSDLILNVSGTNAYSFNGVIRNQGGTVSLTKSGTGTQTLVGNLIDYTGATTVNGGRLVFSDNDDSHTQTITIASGAVFETRVQAQAYKNLSTNHTITGTGTYEKTGPGNLAPGWSGGTNFTMGTGGLVRITEGQIRLEYGAMSNWTTNKSDLFIEVGAALDLWDNNNAGVFVNALNGYGSIYRTRDAIGTITVGVDNGSGTFNGLISNTLGTTHLVKNGTGTQSLAGTCTYTGNTTVNGGTLELTSTGSLTFSVKDASNNQVNGTGSLVLDGTLSIDTSAVTLTSGNWTLVNTATLSCTYGSNFSPGFGWTEDAGVWTYTDVDKIWTFTEATGVLNLASTASYASWIDGYFPGETNPAIIGGAADPDQDGIANAAEMVVGGNPATGMDVALLPTLELVTDPAGLPAGNYFLFTYRRTDQSVAAGLLAMCQHDTDLTGTWTPAQDGVNGVSVLVDDNYGSFVPPATDTDRVRVYVPRGSNVKLFGRLNVEVP